MPLVENDVLFALLNSGDRNHEVARRLFGRIRDGELSAELSSVALVEMELVYMSEGLGGRLVGDLAAVADLPNVEVVPLTPDVAAAYLREAHGLTFFDSHYAATALAGDGVIVSFDKAYDDVPGLTRVEPEKA